MKQLYDHVPMVSLDFQLSPHIYDCVFCPEKIKPCMVFCFLELPYISGVLILHQCRLADFNIKYFVLKVNIGMNEMYFQGIIQAFQPFI